jgi:hypothetical protein
MYRHILATAALFLMFCAAPNTAMADCKPQVSGQGSSNLGQGPAEVAARASWSANAISYYGAAYHFWPKARNKQPANCKKQGKFPKTHVCIYRAEPCS